MKVFAKVFLTLSSIVFSQYALGQVDTKSDRFTGDTTYTSHLTPELNSPLRPQTIVTVGQDGALKSAVIMLIGSSKGWKYLTCNSTHWLLDGKPIALDESKHIGKVLDGGYVIESMVQMLNVDQLRKFSQATTVEYKVCNDEGEMRTGERDDIRTIAGKVNVALK